MISGMRLVRQVLLTAVTPRISPGTLRLIHRHPIPFHSSLRSGVCSRGFGLLQRRDLPQIPEDWESGEYDIHSQSTIYALSTAPGKSAIAVVRISGPACIDVRLAESCFLFPPLFTKGFVFDSINHPVS